LIGWIETLEQRVPAGVNAPEWAFKIDQLRAAALFLLPHPRTLERVGLPHSDRVPALLAALAGEPGVLTGDLAAHGEAGLCRLLEHGQRCPDQLLVADIRRWMQLWLAKTGNRDLMPALHDLLLPV
jgi:hypothetical protein